MAQKVSALSLDQQQRLEKDAAKKEAKAEAKADAEAKKRQVKPLIDINAGIHYTNTLMLCHRQQRYFLSSRILSPFVMFFDPSQITIKRIARNKNKHVTAVHGLEQFGERFFIFRTMHLSAFDRPSWPKTLVHLDSALTSLTVGIDLKKAAKQFAQKFATGASVTKNAQGLDEVVVQGDVSEEIQELLEGQVGVLKGIDADKIVRVEEKTKKKGGASAAGGED